MKKLFLFLLFCLPLSSADISQENKPPTVKVLLAKLADDALVEVKGGYILYNTKTGDEVHTTTKSKRAKVSTKEGCLHWGETLTNIQEVRLVPNASLLVNGIQYKGCIEIYSIGGTINIVNEVDTENFIKSVLGTKITDTYSNETLDAIAITERTNLYYLIQKDAYASWQVEAEKASYHGVVPAQKNKRVQDAVERTRDLILNYKKQPFAATYSENCAGKSVSYSSIYRRKDFAPSGVSTLPSSTNRAKSAWTSSIPLKNLANQFGLSSVLGIDLYHAEKSSKIYAIRLTAEEGVKDINFFTFQKTLGVKNIPSNDFQVAIRGKKVLFKGFGKGGGIGLCLESSEMLSLGKNKIEKILSLHFPETKLVNIRQETGRAPITSPIWR